MVMQIEERYLLVLTPEGEFLQAIRQDKAYSVGEEIQFFPKGRAIFSRSFWTVKNWMKTPALIIATALFIFLGVFFSMFQNNKAYAYMSIDVNPSLELGINKKMQVVELTPFNKEGKKVISQMKDWKNEEVYGLTEKILKIIDKDGFLKNNHRVIISTVRTNQADQEVEKKLENNIKEIEASVFARHLKLTMLSCTEKDLQKAHKLGITAGKYQIENTKKAGAETTEPDSEQKKKGIPANPTVPQPSEEIKPAVSQPPEKKKQVAPESSEQSMPKPSEQIKRQDENGSKSQYHHFERKIQPEAKNQAVPHPMPPGQLKKDSESEATRNNGHVKKRFFQVHKEEQNHKQKQNEYKHDNHHDNSHGHHSDNHQNGRH